MLLYEIKDLIKELETILIKDKRFEDVSNFKNQVKIIYNYKNNLKKNFPIPQLPNIDITHLIALGKPQEIIKKNPIIPLSITKTNNNTNTQIPTSTQIPTQSSPTPLATCKTMPSNLSNNTNIQSETISSDEYINTNKNLKEIINKLIAGINKTYTTGLSI